MAALFDACRSIHAVEVARAAGIELHRKGAREWACCPLHEERSASLCFFSDGGWKCFGCNAGGDAVAFYAALHRIPPLEAARALMGQHATGEPIQRKRAEKADEERKLLAIYRHAMDRLEDNASWDNPDWVEALQAASCADMALENLYAGRE